MPHATFSPAAKAILKAASAVVEHAAIENDQDEEREAYEAGADIEDHLEANEHYLPPPLVVDSNKKAKNDPTLMSKSLKTASADVIVTGTQNEYRRYAKYCKYNSQSTEAWQQTLEKFCRLLYRKYKRDH